METSEELNVPEGYTAVHRHRARELTETLLSVGVLGLREGGAAVCRGCPDVFCTPGGGNCPVNDNWVLVKTDLLLKGRLLGLKIEGELT